MKAHLSGTHQITEFIAMRYQDEKLEKLDQPIEKSIKPHSASKQEFLTKNVMGFVIVTVQPLSIVDDTDFINMINGIVKRYRVLCTTHLKNRMYTSYEAGIDAIIRQSLHN